MASLALYSNSKATDCTTRTRTLLIALYPNSNYTDCVVPELELH